MQVNKNRTNPFEDLKWSNKMWCQLRAFPITDGALPQTHSQKHPITNRKVTIQPMHISILLLPILSSNQMLSNMNNLLVHILKHLWTQKNLVLQTIPTQGGMARFTIQGLKR